MEGNKNLKIVLVTGASGFIGQRFCVINEQRYQIKRVSLKNIEISRIDLSGIDVILHLAAIAHQNGITNHDYFRVNYVLTKELAIKAAKSGVKHFVFMSSTRVFSEKYEHLTPESDCQPTDALGKSKLKAERLLESLSSEDFTVSVIRAPLVYGPGVKGNIKKLTDLVGKKKWIALGNINNARSMVSLDTLIALVDRIIEKRRSGMFLIQNNPPISTSKLISLIAEAKGSDINLVSIPTYLRHMIKLLKPSIHKRIFGSLTVDDHDTRRELEFTPKLNTMEGINIMIKYSKDEQVV